MSNKISTGPLSGFMELLPEEQLVFNRMMDIIRSVYEQNGYIPMDQPIIDRTESLLANVGVDTTKEIISIEREDDKALALRFDLTVPLARYVANNYGHLTFPFRRYAIGKVYRGERPQAGRFREFYQCDVDIIGNEQLSVRYDADIVLLMARVLEKLDIGPFEIRINNRKLLNGLFQSLEITNTTEILRIIDKKEKISSQEMTTLLQQEGLNQQQIDTISIFIDAVNIDDLPKIDNPLYAEGLDEVKQVISITIKSGLEKTYFVWDPSIARGLDYYTGTVFETCLLNNPEIGSVCSGGRYDDLASAYTTRKLPGVGTSIGLSRLFDQLMKKGVIIASLQKTKSQVLIVPLTDDLSYALLLQNQLLKSEIACEISFSDSKLDKRMSYANKLGIPYTVIIGEDEVTSDLYTFRDMDSGSEEKLSASDIIGRLQ